jgi:hypothetical protein
VGRKREGRENCHIFSYALIFGHLKHIQEGIQREKGKRERKEKRKRERKGERKGERIGERRKDRGKEKGCPHTNSSCGVNCATLAKSALASFVCAIKLFSLACPAGSCGFSRTYLMASSITDGQ